MNSSQPAAIRRSSAAHELDLESLRCFLVGAETLNFREAATRVHLSPAAYGERIRRLEEQLDARLFERTTRRVQLSGAGLRLVPHAHRALDAAARCADAVHEQRRAPYELTLGTRHELGMTWIVPALAALERADPARTLHLDFGSGPDLLERVEQGQIDAAVVSLPLARAAVQHVNLHPEHYTFVGAPKLLKAYPLRKAADAIAHTLLDVRPGFPLFRYLMDAAPPEVHWQFAAHNYLGTIAAIRARALRGAGVAVLPTYFVQADIKGGRLQRVMPKLKPRSDFFRLIWRAGHPRDAELRELGETLRGRPLR